MTKRTQLKLAIATVLIAVALAIIKRLALKYPEGKLFRNRLGNPWTSDAFNCRCATLRETLGFDTIFPYAVRHTFITDMLIAGIDAISLAELVGHKDATMILKVYQHVALVPGHLRERLVKGTDDARLRGAQSA
jgi:site-specific recombinase XerD